MKDAYCVVLGTSSQYGRLIPVEVAFLFFNVPLRRAIYNLIMGLPVLGFVAHAGEVRASLADASPTATKLADVAA